MGRNEHTGQKEKKCKPAHRIRLDYVERRRKTEGSNGKNERKVMEGNTGAKKMRASKPKYLQWKEGGTRHAK